MRGINTRGAENFFAGIFIAIFGIIALACVGGFIGSIVGLIGGLCNAVWGWTVAGECFALFCSTGFVLLFFFALFS